MHNQILQKIENTYRRQTYGAILLFLICNITPVQSVHAHRNDYSEKLNKNIIIEKKINTYTISYFKKSYNNNKPLLRDIQINNEIPPQKFIQSGISTGVNTKIESPSIEIPPHLRVEFIIQTLDNMSVGKTGAKNNMRINWSVHSPTASNEPDFKPNSWVPDPGSALQFNDQPIYIGHVANGCGDVPVYPITFYSEIYSGEEVLGSFSASDNNTIQPNGYWNFTYTVRVYDDKNNMSDIIVKGIIKAFCEW